MFNSNAMFIDKSALPESIDDSTCWDSDGTLLPMPAQFWASQSRLQRVIWGNAKAIYSFPTIEAVEFVRRLIAGRERQTIEIGAGNGSWCKALGIHGTDSYQQKRPSVARIYAQQGQPVINYGKHVECIDGIDAVRRYKPKVVVASWVTHRLDQRRSNKGNVHGINEHKLLQLVDEYIFIGNTDTHSDKHIFVDITNDILQTHKLEIFHDETMMFSRAQGGLDFIAHVKRVAQFD